MATMNVSLPDQMKAWVETQAESGRYGNASDYVRDLIRRDQERQASIGRIQNAIDEGLRSGVSTRSMDELLEEARRRAGVAPADVV
ncbi:MAG TPA: type II toxin-antitoxin system ParD family antitoxin [Bosea sp. (in: a-proteobacteria)]